MAIGIDRGDPARDRRPRVGSGRDRRGDRRRDPDAGGRRRPVRPDPVWQRVGRHRRLPGRDPGRASRSDRPSSPGSSRSTSREGASRPGERRGGGWETYERAAPRRPLGQGGAQPAALSVGAGSAAGKRKEVERIDAGVVGRTGSEDRPAAPRGAGDAGRRSSATDPRRRRASSILLERIGVVARERRSSSSSSTTGGEPDRLSLEALTFARDCRATGGAVEAVLVGPARSGGRGGSARMASRRPTSSTTTGLAAYAPAAWAAALAELIDGPPPAVSSPAAATGATRCSRTSRARPGLPMAANVHRGRAGRRRRGG